jgi:hypothetical protein
MSKVILQPAGSPEAKAHFEDTILSAVTLSRISNFVSSSELKTLTNIYPDGAHVWGVTPGKKFGNRNKWDRIEVGDVALFSGQGHIFTVGTVTYKIHNKGLALDLWGTNAEGETWEYIFF